MSDYEELANSLFEVLHKLADLEEQQTALQAKITALEARPMTDASPHWRKDRDGQPTILELIHRTGSTYEQANSRRREYIGKDPDKIAEARERRKRFKQHRELKRQLYDTEYQATRIRRGIKQLALLANEAEQKPLWGQNQAHQVDQVSPPETWGQGIDAGSSQASPQMGTPGLSPQEEMSPSDVISSFEKSDSPFIRSLAKDLRSHWSVDA